MSCIFVTVPDCMLLSCKFCCPHFMLSHMCFLTRLCLSLWLKTFHTTTFLSIRFTDLMHCYCGRSSFVVFSNNPQSTRKYK